MEVGLRHGNLIHPHPVDLVRDADRDHLESGEDVELGQYEVRDPVDARRITGDRGVVPAGAAGSTGGGTELETFCSQEFSRLIVQLRRERSRADPRRIGLDHGNDSVESVRGDSGSGGGTTTRGVRGRDERIRAVVDIQHRRLAALEEHGLASVEGLIENEARVGNHGAQAFGIAKQTVHHLVDTDSTPVVDLHQEVVLLVESTLDLLAQDVFVEQILNPDADPVDLVGIRRSDAATGRAYLPLAEKPLGHLVERAVVLGDDMRVGAHQQA